MRKRYRGLSYGTPLALSDEMILAVCAGRKTHTIRALSKSERDTFQEERSHWPCFWDEARQVWHKLPGPYGEIGDYLWVRESYRVDGDVTEYRLLSDPDHVTDNSNWKPVVGMPEGSSRLCLLITGYRFVSGVRNLKPKDVIDDGFNSTLDGKLRKADLRSRFSKAWNTRYRDSQDKWEANPPVWITEFRLLSKEENDKLKKATSYLK